MRDPDGFLNVVNHNGVPARRRVIVHKRDFCYCVSPTRVTEHERDFCYCDSPTRVTVHERDFCYCDSPTRVTVHEMREIQIGFSCVNIG